MLKPGSEWGTCSTLLSSTAPLAFHWGSLERLMYELGPQIGDIYMLKSLGTVLNSAWHEVEVHIVTALTHLIRHPKGL